jgi:hypothetical protein
LVASKKRTETARVLHLFSIFCLSELSISCMRIWRSNEISWNCSITLDPTRRTTGGGTWKAEDPAPKTNPSGKSRRVIAEALLGTTMAAASKKTSSRGSKLCTRSRRSTAELLMSGGAMPSPSAVCTLCTAEETLLLPRGGDAW